jgi:hypothetical protein
MEQDKFISVRLFGGLGNQIFQYMAGKLLASERNLLLYVDTSWLQDGYTHLNSNISEFQFYKPDREFGHKHKNPLHLYMDRLATIAARNIPLVARVGRINAPRSTGYENFSKVKPGVQLRGYYQSPQYFAWLMKTGEITKSSFDLNKPSESFNSIKNQVPSQGFLAVHVRGGDYLKENTSYVQLTSEYYKKAISIVSETCGSLPVWVFTDDVDYAKQILSSFSDLFYVGGKLTTAAEEMKLMSMAKGIVCANSTFSYWASVISDSASLIVAPNSWIKAHEQPEDFFPKGWKLI